MFLVCVTRPVSVLLKFSSLKGKQNIFFFLKSSILLVAVISYLALPTAPRAATSMLLDQQYPNVVNTCPTRGVGSIYARVGIRD